ncbi:hypothetical protein GOV06_01755 [Candidatus Woesearchaeota archaeon]|nr:hypothetical protein [Candidatus Woesearchaeota archaeon]
MPIEVIESATNIEEVIKLCKKYSIVPASQPTAVFSRFAEILYRKNPDAKYAVCYSEARVELVDFSNDETALEDYGRQNNYELISRVNKDGSGMVIPLR